jgi:hypothetical protein
MATVEGEGAKPHPLVVSAGAHLGIATCREDVILEYNVAYALLTDGSSFAICVSKRLVALSTLQHANALFRAHANTTNSLVVAVSDVALIAGSAW